MTKFNPEDHFSSKVLGHPSGLFVLFFTEMWERFSFYGMRVLLVNFLTMSIIGSNPGWEWSTTNATALFGTYAGLLYLTPILGGMIADKLTGYRWAVVIGALIMTLGHASMALETELSLYVGLGLLVIGTGFFKPNITSIISGMYATKPEKKDGAYTIFYMGVNAGAFFGMMLCGYLAERVGWAWGFGLAGIFMLLGTLQFWLAKPIFGGLGDVPNKDKEAQSNEALLEEGETKRNKFTLLDKILVVITATIGLMYLIDDPLAKIADVHILPKEFLFPAEQISGSLVITIIGLVLFLILVTLRIVRYDKIVRNRMIAFVILAFFTVFFWMAFEQGAHSLVLFARDFTDRTLEGTQATIFNIVNTLLTIVPLLIISWVVFLLAKRTFKKIAISNITLALSFVGVWAIAIWMLVQDYNSQSYEFEYKVTKVAVMDQKTGKQKIDKKTEELVFDYPAVTESTQIKSTDIVETRKASIIQPENALKIGQAIAVHEELGVMRYLDKDKEAQIRMDYTSTKRASAIIKTSVLGVIDNQVEVTVSWFSILNSFFIIAFASIFSKWWESKYNPSGAVKFGLGLIIMGLGYAALSYGSNVIPQGAEPGSIRVGMIWLILAYLFHTLGELCSSPVGLSYVSKLVPARMIAFMFGMWYLAIAIGNKLAATIGGMSHDISEKYDLSTFFLIVTVFPLISGIVIILLNPVLKKLMHGVK